VRLVVGPRQERRTLAVRPSAGDSIEVALLRATGSNHAADTIVVHLARADVRTWAPAARAQAAWLVAHHCGDADTEGPPTVRAQPVAASPGAAGGGDAGRLSVGCAASLDEHGRNPVQYTYVEIPHHDRDGPWTKVDLSGPAQMRLVIDALARMAGAGSAAAPAGQPRAGARP
jgi:hypothetical protein